MHGTRPLDWLDSLALASEARAIGAEARFYQAVNSGRLTRCATGVYLPTAVWAQLSPEERFVARVEAASRRHGLDEPFSGTTAAVLWELPFTTPLPDRPEIVMTDRSGGRSRPELVRRLGARTVDDVEIDGYRVTSLVRTLVDVSRRAPLELSVPMLDHAQRPSNAKDSGVRARRVDHDGLLAELERSASRIGLGRASSAIALADGRSGSPGEGLSRVTMHRLGIPAPVLQQPFHDGSRLVGITDFWWPELRLIGEFDGYGKYMREEFLNGRTPAEAVIDEKRREDDLRALGTTVMRWGWAEARSPRKLERLLARFGLGS
ncbi:hypothetical protein [Schumannella soli]|uniref:Type IV toxin-antitoxin system AbiEi family antitoxin domain-containing protein n=1 Tax=Schumannella soli TaxID=2590779 RepID=A0A506Y868_9MICO|nr:hypothetical protein [Schumannella soli]TPW77258.1 hypothetical protein FJ657_00695 [Schumannella soli]